MNNEKLTIKPNSAADNSMGKRKGGLSGFFNYFLRSFKVTFLILVGLAILGVWSAVTLPRESTPEVEIPIAVVITPYPGASAKDVEELVTTPIEDELINLEGLENLYSSSRLGISTVTVEFSADEDLKDAIRRLRDNISEIRGLPAEAELPEVVEINFEDEPIISISLGGTDNERLLSVLAEELAKDIENVPGVSQVDIVGATAEEIRIIIDPQRLTDLGLSIGQLIGAIKSSNINAPFGQLDTEQFNYDLRLTGRFNNVGDVADIPLSLPNGQTVPLSTIADIKFTLAEKNSASRVSLQGKESTPAVTLSVRKKTGGNIVKIVKEVQARVEEAKQSNLPADITVTTFANRADDIKTQLSNVYRSGIQTLIIVFALLWLFLGWRPAIITSLAIPLTFSISFLIFGFTNTTLNGISLFSLILSLGLLVDTAIVVVEGICGHKEMGVSSAGDTCVVDPKDNQQTKEHKLQERAAQVVDQFTKPLIGGTMTTVAAFFPMLLVSGIIGQFLKVIPIVVTATLTSSLLVALAFIPPVAVEILSRMKGNTEKERIFDRQFTKFRHLYERIITVILARKKIQIIFILTLVVLLIVGLSLPFTGLIKTGLFPPADIDFMVINAELAPGTKLAKTSETVKKIEDIVTTVPEVTSYVTNIGSSTSSDLGGGSSSEALASFFVNLNKERQISSLDIADNLRSEFAAITEATIVIEELSAGPPAGAPIEMRIIGDDINELDRISQEIIDILVSMEGVIDINRNIRNSAGEFNFVFNEDALAAAGLSVTDTAQLLRASVFGLETTTFLNSQNEEVSVYIEANEQTVDSIDDILALPLLTRAGKTITLGQIASVNLESSIDAIRHRDGERTITITADAATGFTPNELTVQIQEKIKEYNFPEGYLAEFGGEQQETAETFTELYQSMIIAVILILLILVLEFNSYLQPLLIFISIPLALIGVLFGLLLFNGQLNFAAFIGLVSLTGIVVNNAIILVDRMNRNRDLGLSITDAIKEATNTRLRPIILTTLTTAGGIAPLIWVDEFFRDMAITLITGLVFSSILTLVLIPILYFWLQNFVSWVKKYKDLPPAPESTSSTSSHLSPVP